MTIDAESATGIVHFKTAAYSRVLSNWQQIKNWSIILNLGHNYTKLYLTQNKHSNCCFWADWAVRALLKSNPYLMDFLGKYDLNT